MYFSTWKTRRPKNLLKEVLTQKTGICLTIGVIRHFTALLIHRGDLTEDEELSIEELIQLIRLHLPHLCDKDDRYSIYDFNDCERILRDYGTDNPLRYDFENPRVYDPNNPPQRFKIRKMTTFFRKDFTTTHLFEKSLARQLNISPLACVAASCTLEILSKPYKAEIEMTMYALSCG